MRIIHVIQRYWPYTGGSERHYQEISERLASEGHDVTLFTTDALDLELFWDAGKRRVGPSEETHNGVKICRFPVRHLPWPRLSFPGTRWAMANLSTLPIESTPVLARLCGFAPWVPALAHALDTLEGPVDVIGGMNICFESLLYPALRAARRLGAAFVVTPLTHLGEESDGQVRKYYTMRHQMSLIGKSDGVLVQTDIEQEYLLRQGISPSLLTKAGVGVNPDEVLGGVGERFRQKYGIEEPIVLYLGTLAYDKGTFHLIEAMRALWAEGNTAALVLAGPLMDAVTRFLASQPEDVRRRVRVLGFIPEQDKHDLLLGFFRACDAIPNGLVWDRLLEAWLYGKPVIGAIAGGVPEVIRDGDDGYLVRFGDVTALAERIAFLLSHPDVAREMGARGRQKTLDRYTWGQIYPIVREFTTVLLPFAGRRRGRFGKRSGRNIDAGCLCRHRQLEWGRIP